MGTISTEGRIFAARVRRDLAAREAAGIAALVPGPPGAKDWFEAFRAFGGDVSKTCSKHGPIKAAARFRAGLDCLLAAQKNGICFVNCRDHRKRSGYINVLTYSVGRHPLVDIDDEGILVQSHFCMLRRNGEMLGGVMGVLAFVSLHALGRLYERADEIDLFGAAGSIGYCGIAGLLLRASPKHFGAEINLMINNIVCVGVVRQPPGDEPFYDVITVIEPNQFQAAKATCGAALAGAVVRYLKADDSDPAGYLDSVPVLPANGSDFVSRRLASH